MGNHVIKGLIKFIRTLLDLQLLSVDLILDVIDSVVQLGDVHLSVLKSGFSSLVFVLNLKDFVLKLLFSLKSLLR